MRKQNMTWSSGLQLKYSTLFILSLLISISNARVEFDEDMQDVMDMVHEVCVGNSGVNEADIKKCEEGVFANDKKLGCYMFCLLEEASFVGDDNLIDYDMLVSLIPEQWRDAIDAMLNKCKHLDVPEKDVCDKAMELHQCMYKADPENYFIF